jgi:putative membrane protein
MNAIAALFLLADADGWDHHWWPIWPILWAALIGVAVWLVVRRRDRGFDPLNRAREVLAERYARGELSIEEYRARLADLQSGGSG